MKIIAAAALIVSSFTPIALSPLVSAAAADPVNGSLCGLRMSASSGWICDKRIWSETNYSVGNARGVNGDDVVVACQDHVRTTADYVGINPGGRAVAAFTQTNVTTDEAVGSEYDTPGGCNYPFE